MTKDHMRVHAIFEAVCDMPTVDRNAFLDKECLNDQVLRAEVESLLKHHFTSAQTEISEEKVCDIAVDHQLGDSIDGYRIISILGEGGMGIVYLAGQSSPVRRKVALKIVKAGMDTKQVIARFEAERQALAIMHHQGIAQVYDAGVTKEGRPYFVLEYVEGNPITESCDMHKLTTRERLELMAKVCDAIQHAHSKGVIHRDLKPSNIMVVMNDKGILEPKIIDFGVAKATSGKLTDQTFMTQIGRFIGTPAYMSPEQADMKVSLIDTRTDVYALGVVLYELLTGKLPFDPEVLYDSGLEKFRDIVCEQDPPRPSTHIS
jgi:serine/threonine-protein kinase